MDPLKEEVWEALNNAIHNGYDEVYTGNPEVIAAELNGDMHTIEGPLGVIALYVIEWQEKHRNE